MGVGDTVPAKQRATLWSVPGEEAIRAQYELRPGRGHLCAWGRGPYS